MEAREILQKLDNIEDLPTLSPIAARVNDMVGDPDTSVRDLSEVIEKDQPITTRILKLVNSAFFGLTTRVGNIPHALVLLGFNTVRNAVLSLSVIDSFSLKKNLEGFDISEFWRHSIAVAVTSRFMAEKTRLHSGDDSFTAGLLHDIGKFLLSQYFPDLFMKVRACVQGEGISFAEAEKKAIPVNHGQIGSHLAKRFRLPLALSDAIRYHHAPPKGAFQLSLNLILIVHAADAFVNRMSGTAGNGTKSSLIQVDVGNKLASLVETSQDWVPALQEEIEAACSFFLQGVKHS